MDVNATVGTRQSCLVREAELVQDPASLRVGLTSDCPGLNLALPHGGLRVCEGPSPPVPGCLPKEGNDSAHLIWLSWGSRETRQVDISHGAQYAVGFQVLRTAGHLVSVQ